MIEVFKNGTEFIEANGDFLNTNSYLSNFFFLDAPMLKSTDSINYAMRCTNGGKTLLAMRVLPFNLMLFGDKELVPELFSYIVDNKYQMKNYLCESELGYAINAFLTEKYGTKYEEALAMDFMEATEITEDDYDGVISATEAEVTSATEAEVDEIFECLQRFVIDCNLEDEVTRDSVAKNIAGFRIIKADGKIASIAFSSDSGESFDRITEVYTRNEYRNRGFAHSIVNNIKNDIIRSGKKAVLNVDRRNPISNHIYTELGFKRLFSQGEFRKIK